MRVICTRTEPCYSTGDCNKCRYQTLTFKAEVGEWPGDEDHLLAALARDKAVVDYASHVVWQFGTLLDGFAYLASRFEEVCGERADLQEAFFHDAEVFCLPCPGDPEDYTFVRAHYRPKPRRSKSVKTEATPTGDKDGEPGASPARSGDQPGASGLISQGLADCAAGRVSVVDGFLGGVTVEGSGYPDGLSTAILSRNGPESASMNVGTSTAAVCRWEVGRWL